MPTPKQYADALSATPRNSWKYLADAMQPISEFADTFKVKQDVPLVGGMSAADFTGLKGAFGLADDASYGKYPIRGASLQTAKVDPRVIDAMGLAGALMPVAKNVGKAALREGARQIETGTGIGRAALDPRMNMATVYHGSPYKFDKFDFSKIGTGEGAQAYGHGGYLADSRGVATEYRDKLSGWQPGTQAAVARNNGDLQAAIKESEDGINHYKELINNGGGGMMERAKSLLGISQKKLADLHAIAAGKAENTGNLYKVDLPDEHIAKMLDWDKPLSEQSKDVQDVIGAEIKRIGGSAYDGETAYKELMFEARMNGSKSDSGAMRSNIEAAAASKRLADLGIPGIKYLDGGSRGAGEGSSNYVVFPGNEGLLSILERNGQPINKFPKTDGEIRSEIAQRNAALPISDGGLGLPANNMPMDRANAPGMFPTDAYHFSRHGADVQELDSGKYAIAPFDAVGTHVGSKEQVLDRFNNTVGYKVNNPMYANDELKGVTYPLRVRTGRQMLGDDGRVMSETPISLKFSETADYGDLRTSNAALRENIFSKYDSIPYVNEVELPGAISHILPPANIRSRFAAFDPFRKHEADILAGVGIGGMLDPEAVSEEFRKKERK